MVGHLLIVDPDDARRAALRASLDRPEGEGVELADPALLSDRVARSRPNLLLLDWDEGQAAVAGLRHLRALPGLPLPTMALVPPGRPDLRLAAVRAGADDAVERGTPDRLLRARVRSLLRQHDDTDIAPSEAREIVWPGLSEAPAAFGRAGLAPAGFGLAAFAAAAFASDSPYPSDLAALPSTLAAAAAGLPPARVGLLSAWPAGAVPSTKAIGRLLQAEVARLRSTSEISDGGRGFDLVVIDGAGTRGDLAQGTQVLALLADLLGRQRSGPASTLVLLPGSAVETAALALDLGASDVVAGPVATPELALRARALIVRRHLRRALRDQVRLGLRAALTDPLTGLHNRRYAEAALRRMGEGEQAPGCGMALVMIDIDHFKTINDTHGHAAGDCVLAEVARRLRSVLRPCDLVARIGGEEFLVALGSATAEEAGLVAERLRQAIGGRPFVIDPEGRAQRAPGPASPQARFGQAATASDALQPKVGVTASVGLAMGPSERLDGPADLAALLRRAGDALYESKSAGRDAVSVAAPTAA